MPRPSRPLLTVPLLLAAASCATMPPRPPIPTTRTVAGPPAEVRARVEAAMRGLGLSPEATGPTAFRAESRAARAEWAECDAILTYDFEGDGGSRRSGWAYPGARGAVVTAAFDPAEGGTRVDVSTRFAATYTNRFVNLPTTAACESNGVVEAALLGAAGGPAR